MSTSELVGSKRAAPGGEKLPGAPVAKSARLQRASASQDKQAGSVGGREEPLPELTSAELRKLPELVADAFARGSGARWEAFMRELYAACPRESLPAFLQVLRCLEQSKPSAEASKASSSSKASKPEPGQQQAAPVSIQESAADLESLLRGQELLLGPTPVSCVLPRASLLLQLTKELLIVHSAPDKKTGKPTLIVLKPGDLERVISVSLPNKRQQMIALVLYRELPETGSDLLLLQVPLADMFPPQDKKKTVVVGRKSAAKEKEGASDKKAKAQRKKKKETEEGGDGDRKEDGASEGNEDGEAEDDEEEDDEEDDEEEGASDSPDPEMLAAAAKSPDFSQWFRGSEAYLRSRPRPLHEALGNWLAHWGRPQQPRAMDRFNPAAIKCYMGRSEGSLYPVPGAGLLFLGGGRSSTLLRLGSTLVRAACGRTGQSTFDFGVVALEHAWTKAEEPKPSEKNIEFSMIDREKRAALEDFVTQIAKAHTKHAQQMQKRAGGSGQAKAEDDTPGGEHPEADEVMEDDDDDSEEDDSDFSGSDDEGDSDEDDEGDEGEDDNDEDDESSEGLDNEVSEDEEEDQP